MEPSEAAKRQKKYRERLKTLHPEKYAEAKRKNAERMRKNRKKITECNDEEKQSLRQEWRNQKKKQNADNKTRSELESFVATESTVADKERSLLNTGLQKKETPTITDMKSGKKKRSENNEEEKNSEELRNKKNTNIEEENSQIEFECCVATESQLADEEISQLNTELEKKNTPTITDTKSDKRKSLGKERKNKTKTEIEEENSQSEFECFVDEKSTHSEMASVPTLQKLAFMKCSLYFQDNDEDKSNVKKTEEQRKKWRDYKLKNNAKKRANERQLQKWREYKQKGKVASRNTNLIAENKKLKNQIVTLKTGVMSLRKQLKKERQKIKRIQNKNQELMEKVDRLKKDYYIDLPSTTDASNNDATPITKSVDNFINENLPRISELDKEKVKKKLTEQTVFINSVKSAYQTAKDNKSKHNIKSIIFDNEKVKQYKLKTKLATYIGLKSKIRRTHKKKKFASLQIKFQEFYERDDISRATAGKKEVKVQKKSKRQRRYLLGSLKTLYKKYKEEGGICSYSTFKKYRPFYVISPKANSRNTCACIKHENLLFKLKALRSMKVIECQTLDDVLSLTVCDLQSKECAYGECEVCRTKKIEFDHDSAMPNNDVSWYEWTTKAHEYKEKNSEEIKITKKVVKEMKTAPLEDLIYAFSQELDKFKRHAYNIYHQYSAYKNCLNNLDDYSVVFHIDYSENYACKLNTEIQSMHFGASRQQITLHTGVMYIKGQKPVTFCSLSGNNYHGPEAIWAHMSPVLDFVKNKYPYITKVHFYSDGPTTQYRQKKNFYLFSVYMKKYGFTTSTWNFFEASHGKGAADGVGGAIKRKLDSFVNCGLDITSAETAFQLLDKSDTSIKVFHIPEDSIQMLTTELITIPGTMIIHQIVRTPCDEMFYRSLSCFCFLKNTEDTLCKCFDLKRMCLQKPEQSPKEENTEDVAILSDIRNTRASKKFSPQKPEHLTKKGNNKGVTILSNIKSTKENRKYFRIKEYFDPVSSKKVDISHDIFSDFIERGMPKSSNVVANVGGKKRKLTQNKVVTTKKIKTNADCSSSENDNDDYSLQDTSEGEMSVNQYEMDSDVDDDNQSNKKTCLVKEENEKVPMQENVEFLDEDLLSQDDISDSLKEDAVKINDSVLVRYYERNNWKYYIGFVETITSEDDSYFYSIIFLKTFRTPVLKFVTTKKRDYDTVPMLSVVKKIELVQNKQRPQEYLLKNNSDSVYFNK